MMFANTPIIEISLCQIAMYAPAEVGFEVEGVIWNNIMKYLMIKIPVLLNYFKCG